MQHLVTANRPTTVIRIGSGNFTEFTTKLDNLFEESEVVSRPHSLKGSEAYRKELKGHQLIGRFCFVRQGWLVVVDAAYVQAKYTRQEMLAVTTHYVVKRNKTTGVITHTPKINLTQNGYLRRHASAIAARKVMSKVGVSDKARKLG